MEETTSFEELERQKIEVASHVFRAADLANKYKMFWVAGDLKRTGELIANPVEPSAFKTACEKAGPSTEQLSLFGTFDIPERGVK